MSYVTGATHNILLTLQDDDMWRSEFVDGLGKVIEDMPKFHSRYKLWAHAHALQYYADELYRLKQTFTPIG